MYKRHRMCSIPEMTLDKSIFLWLSWICLFLCVVCVFAWLHMQNLVVAKNDHTKNSDTPPSSSYTCLQSIPIEKQEQALRVSVKLFLAFSMVFVILHFVVIA